MKTLFIISLTALSLSARADVFKCTDLHSQRILYQPKPCADAAVEQRIEVKPRSAEEEAAAAARRRDWQARLAQEEALKEKIAKERQEARLRAAEIEAAQQNAAARRELARAQHRLAEEMSHPPAAVPFQPVIDPAGIGASSTQPGLQRPAAIPIRPATNPAGTRTTSTGTSARQSGRWGTQPGSWGSRRGR